MPLTTEHPFNYVPIDSDKAIAVCHRCGKMTEPLPVDDFSEPDLLHAELNWSESPYPVGFEHTNGSHGTIYTCPDCNSRLTSWG